MSRRTQLGRQDSGDARAAVIGEGAGTAMGKGDCHAEGTGDGVVRLGGRPE